MDAIVAKRVGKFSDYDTIKGRLAEVEAAGLSAQEKAEKAAAEAIKEAEAARAELAKVRRDALVAQAAKDAYDPAEVARLLDVDADATDDDVKAAVEALLAAKPYLVRGTQKPTPTPGSSAPAPAAAGLLTLDEIGRLDPRQVARDKDLYAQVIKSRDHWARTA